MGVAAPPTVNGIIAITTTTMAGFLAFLSALFGWVYTLCWSASFYPQPLLNWRRRSTSGTTVDFPLLNVLGFAAYLASNLAFYYSPLVRAQYAARHPGLAPTVQFNDITFALHALVLSALTVSQYLFARPLWRFASRPAVGARPSRGVLGITAGSFCAVAFTYSLAARARAAAAASNKPVDPAADWCELDVVYAVGYVKLLVTLVKYTPQLLANWRNRSTRGWSIWQVLLDLAGGVLSIAQQGVDSWILRDWSGITGNPVKFALGNASLVYDTLFIAQHYVLYRGAAAADDDDNSDSAANGPKPRWRGPEEPLLGDDGGGDDGDERRRRRLD
ncbi:cystinosin [Purpureocillium lavendulum]|uniref:Cystinosin n=1 Tax=Purpureocillium lavendulum TaxID=1247861 RepID=A0AB34FHU7_9HYPO|nr:cystinosin [Purpureocillium lavendulum]